MVSVTNDGSTVVNDFGIIIEKNCTITNLVELLKSKLHDLKDSKRQFAQKIMKIFQSMGSTQRRNATSVGDAIADCVKFRSLCSLLQTSDKSDTHSIFIPWISNNE